MSGYVFLSNSNKPTIEEQNCREKIKLTNVSRPYLQTALDLGYNVYFGVNRRNPQNLECELPVQMYDSHTYRSITALRDNKIAFDNLMKTIKTGNIDVIHCNTPVGGMIGRICGKILGVKHVIYTAHGFHFYKGAPLFNRTVLKLAEKIMARWTDAIITMNREDYEAAKKFHLRNNGKVYYIPGVGIDTQDFFSVIIDKNKVRESIGLSEDDVMCISMGDLIRRKNYETAIRAISLCNDPKIHYIICGEGPELQNLQNLIKELKLEKQVHFLGYRNDIKELAKASDIFLFTTLQEGMPRSMMEAMASGLPCIASNIRGNVDLLEEGVGGFLVSPRDEKTVAKRIETIANNKKLQYSMGQENLKKIIEFDIEVVSDMVRSIYKEILKK